MTSELTRRELLGSAAMCTALSFAGALACGERDAATKGLALVRAELARLLESELSALETGFTTLADGMLLVASLHHVRNVTSAMFAWWAERAKTPEEFRMWHPKEHLSWQRDEARGYSLVEHVFDGEIQRTKIQRRDASDYFDPTQLAAARLTAVCSRGGLADRDGWGVHLIHLCKDTDWGCRVRTRLFLGDFEPEPPAPIRRLMLSALDDGLAARMIRHQSEEFVHLAGFLPALYARETAA